jgi:transcription elongation factor SPT6
MIKSEKKMLLQALEMKVVQAVSDVGVDIHHATRHQHYGVMLAFLPGLGLRKAEKLIRDIGRRPDKVSSRFALHDQALFLSDIVWTNACGFMRLSMKQGYQRFNPLDNTRIHPMCYEVYDFVRRICADALDVVNKPESQAQIIADVKSNIRKTIEKYFFPDKDGVIKWERVLDVVEFGSSVIGDGGFSRKYKEIKDALEVLVLTDYAEELEVGEKGKRLLELEMIKDELRYPWLDLRRFNNGYSQDDFKNYVKRESLISTHLGQKVPVKVIEVRNGRSPFIIVETDDGVRGFVGESDVSDDRREYRHEELCSMVSIGERRVGVIVGLRYSDKLVLSFRPSVCERNEAWWMRNRVDAAQDERDWWHFFCTKNGKSSDLRCLFDRYFDETEALDAYEKVEQATRAKAIEQTDAAKLQGESAKAPQFEKIDHAVRFHPFFVNMTANEAEDYLRRKMTENRMPTPAVIRPSSKGPAHLALVWAFRPDKFMHIRVDQVPNLRDPSRPMYVIDHPSSNRPFSDIDEIFSEYIGRMHDFVLAMTRHKNFHAGRQAEVESDMRRQVTENPDRVAYYLRYEDDTPGVFAITWMDKSLACKAVKILVTNTVSLTWNLVRSSFVLTDKYVVLFAS